MAGPTSGMERIARIPRSQSDLWETNAGYKITLPIQIGKLMVAFVDSLFGPRATMAALLNYYPEMVQNFGERRFSQIFTPPPPRFRYSRQFSERRDNHREGCVSFFASGKLKINRINIIFPKCLLLQE